jgi:hypothetical protein
MGSMVLGLMQLWNGLSKEIDPQLIPADSLGRPLQHENIRFSVHSGLVHTEDRAAQGDRVAASRQSTVALGCGRRRRRLVDLQA